MAAYFSTNCGTSSYAHKRGGLNVFETHCVQCTQKRRTLKLQTWPPRFCWVAPIEAEFLSPTFHQSTKLSAALEHDESAKTPRPTIALTQQHGNGTTPLVARQRTIAFAILKIIAFLQSYAAAIQTWAHVPCASYHETGIRQYAACRGTNTPRLNLFRSTELPSVEFKSRRR